MSYYTSSMIGIEEYSLNDLIEESSKSLNYKLYRKLFNINTDTDLWIETFNQMNTSTKVLLLEDSIMKFNNNENTETDDKIMKVLDNYIYTMGIPQKEIEKVYSTGTVFDPDGKNINISKYKDNNQITLHTFYTSEKKSSVDYSTINNLNNVKGRIRIYRDNDIGWSDVNKIEAPVYIKYIKGLMKSKNNKFDQYNVYGTLVGSNFKIIDTVKNPKSLNDKRKQARGKMCSNYNINEILEYFLMLKIPQGNGELLDNLSTMRKELKSKFVKKPNELNDDEVKYYYSWIYGTHEKRKKNGELYTPYNTKKYLCGLLSDAMDKAGMLKKWV